MHKPTLAVLLLSLRDSSVIMSYLLLLQVWPVRLRLNGGGGC
uniref:Uncharacterized protein n=1 Tax=Zea mays TaxID=4577 RepID=B4FPT0_MAIZE|nr:unknown [Zea mays]